MPTDAYQLDDAIKDGFLVPPVSVSVPIKFQREGITYKDLSPEEQELWDALEWDEDVPVPDRVEAAALNAWLFNEDTVDKVLAHLMTKGIASRAATGSARRSSSPRARRMPSSSSSGSMRTTRSSRAPSPAPSITASPTPSH